MNDLGREIQKLLDVYVNERTNIVTTADQNIKEHFSQEQYEEILTTLNNRNFFNRTSSFLLKKCAESKKNIRLGLSENKHQQVIDNFKLITKMNEMFSSKITSIKSNRDEVLKEIETYFDSTYDSLVNMLTECISRNNPDKLECFEQSYQTLVILSKLDEDHFNKKMKEVNEHLKKTAQKVNNLFLNSFEDQNFSVTKNLMEIMRKLQAVPDIIRDDEMKKYIKNKIKSLLERINEKFPTDSNIYESVFDKFFSDLNKNLESLKYLEDNFEVNYIIVYFFLLKINVKKIQHLKRKMVKSNIQIYWKILNEKYKMRLSRHNVTSKKSSKIPTSVTIRTTLKCAFTQLNHTRSK